jgi:hypothetical protein
MPLWYIRRALQFPGRRGHRAAAAERAYSTT